MKRYIGNKLISAEPMTKLEYTEIHTTEYVSGDDEDGYLIQNHNSNDTHQDDSCFSWLPKDEFEASYRPIDNMTFGLAIEALKQDKKVARAGWNGKGMWLIFVAYSNSATSEEHPHYHHHGVDDIQGLPWIGMKTADNKLVPWLASQTDVLAEDWQIIE